jgi:sugar phosphate isomerase/epimerase
MRISFSTGTYLHLPLRFSLCLARALGFDGVEWDVSPGYLLGGLGTIQRVFADEGVRPLSVHPPLMSLPGWPRRSAREAERLGALARYLGAALFVLHVPLLRSLDASPAQRYAEALARGRQAGGQHVSVAVENLQHNRRRRRFPVDDLATLVAFCQQHGCGITFDTSHAGANGEDLLASYAIVRPALRNVHLSDASWRGGRARTHLLPGEGELPLGELLEALARDGYDGMVTVEARPDQAGPLGRSDAELRLGKALEFVRRHVTARGTPEPGELSVEGAEALSAGTDE